jgi:hypothetical protein
MLNNFRLRVAEYYDLLVNQIDLKAETFLAENELRDEERTLVEGKRSHFLNEIKRIESLNFKFLDESNFTNDELNHDEAIFKPEFCFIVSGAELADVAIKNSLNRFDVAFGYLVITDKFLSAEQLACYREVLEKYGICTDYNSKLSANNRLFELVTDKSSNIISAMVNI